jgi:hypothetical protein
MSQIAFKKNELFKWNTLFRQFAFQVPQRPNHLDASFTGKVLSNLCINVISPNRVKKTVRLLRYAKKRTGNFSNYGLK